MSEEESPTMPTAQYWKDKFNLIPHKEEGGFYFETYKSDETTSDIPERFGGGNRSFGTAIYYMLEDTGFGAFHALKADEVWHFYSGKPISIYVIKPNGELEVANLGPGQEHPFQFIVPHGGIFASRLKDPKVGDYGLVGATVSPGFEYFDYKVHTRAELLKAYPQHKDIIISLTY